MLAAIGEFERDLIKERAADGVARSTANGVTFGPKPKHHDIDMELLQTWFDRPETDRTELVRKYDISRSTLYRWCRGKNNAAAPDRNS